MTHVESRGDVDAVHLRWKREGRRAADSELEECKKELSRGSVLEINECRDDVGVFVLVEKLSALVKPSPQSVRNP